MQATDTSGKPLSSEDVWGIVVGGTFWIQIGNKVYRAKNGVVTTGLDYILNNGLSATLYIGLISTLTSLAIGDTMASHAGWTEYTGYSEGTRQVWNKSASSGGLINATSVSTFSDAASVTLNGLFVTTVNTKGGTTGTLISTAAFDQGSITTPASPPPVNVTYNFAATAGA